MANQKIKLRNSSATITQTFLIILLVMGIFFGGYAYLAYNTTETNQTLDSKYASVEGNLISYQKKLETKTQIIRDNLDTMKQAGSKLAQVWNGIKGLANTILLTVQFIPITIGVYESTVPTLDIVPTWAFPLIYTGILIFIVFLILKGVKGEPNM